MKKHTLLAAIFASGSILLSGCATADMQAAMGQISGSLNEPGKALTTPGAEGSGSAVSSVRRGGTSLTKTRLMGIFSRWPSTDGRALEWPKVTITNLYFPSDQESLLRLLLKPGDCVVFDEVLWYDGSTTRNSTMCHSAPWNSPNAATVS